MEEKAILLIPGQPPKLVGTWRLGEYYRALELARAWMDQQSITGSAPPAPQPQGDQDAE